MTPRAASDDVLSDDVLSDEAVWSSHRVIRAHSRSFALASRLLPAGVREEAWVIYAWCRRADDAVDENPPAEREPALERLQGELEAIYAGERMEDPVLEAFRAVVRRRGIPPTYPFELLEGMTMDVRGTRFDDLGRLVSYCHKVAGTVGLMMCHVMGVRREQALTHAAHLGIAMQLTNVCRDVREDWEAGRLYLPATWLAEEGAEWLTHAPRGGPFPPEAREPVARVVARLLDEADAYYRSGDRGLADLSWRCALAVRTARAVYADIGRVLRSRECEVTSTRAVVPRWRKAMLLIGALGRASMEAPGRWWQRRRGRAGVGQPMSTLREPGEGGSGPSAGESRRGSNGQSRQLESGSAVTSERSDC